MEGLIPAWEVTKDPQIKDILNQLSKYLLKHQQKDGGWPTISQSRLWDRIVKVFPLSPKICFIGAREKEKRAVNRQREKGSRMVQKAYGIERRMCRRNFLLLC